MHIKNDLNRILSAERGASMVELGLALPLLCLILIGVTDLGFALTEWLRVNSLVQSASSYAFRYANADASGGFTNLYVSLPSDISATIMTAAAQGHSGINANGVTLSITTACRCPSKQGITCPQSSPGEFSATPPKCPDTILQCADSLSSSKTRQSDYICISASQTHQSLFGTRGWSPTFSTTAVINIH